MSKETTSKEMQEMMAKLEAMQAMLEEKEQQLIEAKSKIKPTARKRVQYNVVDYLDSVHTELGLNKRGQMVSDTNKEGLPARGAKSVLSYLYGTGERVPKYHKPIDTAAYQMAFLEDIKEWLTSEHIRPLVTDIINEAFAVERDSNKEQTKE